MTVRRESDPIEGFKETEIGPIPVEWGVVWLGEVASLIMGQSPPSSTYNTEGKGYPFLQGKAEFGEVYPIPVKWCSQPKRIAPRGSILISVRAPVGDVNVAREDYCIGRGLAAINGNESLDNWFLFYLLIFAKRRLEDKGTGSTFKSINKGVLQGFSIPLPPLPEQRRIAHVLGTIQRAIAAQDALIAAARELKRSLMQHLFTYGPVPLDQADQVPLKETEIGLVPAHWEFQTLDDVKAPGKGTIVSGPFGSNIGKRFFVESGVPLIRGCNLTKGNSLFVEEGFVYITEEKAEELANCTALPGDLVFTAAGTIGQVGLIPANCRYSKYVISNKQLRARVDTSRVEPLYLFYWFTHGRMQDLIQKRRRGTSIPVINLGILRSLPVGIPSLSEQREIIDVLAAADRKIEAEEKRKTALQALFKTMLHQL
ncbi:MAG: restriction endonuclease subunit S, partial [Anaerolineae bacterium]|nr:restriction endonuclease subunit S [Anaerolineae bacterium]